MKYYVTSNQLSVVVCGEHIKNPLDAACEAYLTHYKDYMIVSPNTIVSQRGNDWHTHDHDEDTVFETVNILAKAGFIIEDE